MIALVIGLAPFILLLLLACIGMAYAYGRIVETNYQQGRIDERHNIAKELMRAKFEGVQAERLRASLGLSRVAEGLMDAHDVARAVIEAKTHQN